MNLELLNAEAYKHRPITSKVLKKYIESDGKNIWIDKVNGLIYDLETLAKMTETSVRKPSISSYESCYLFSSKDEGDFVLLKNPTKALGDRDDGAYLYDEDTQCRYYLAQSTSDKGFWKMIRVGRTELMTEKSRAEELVLTRLAQQETVTADATEYMLMPMPGINVTTLWENGIPFQNPLEMFKLAHFAIATLGKWLKCNLVHTSLSADCIEQTDYGVQFTGYKHGTPVTASGDASVVYPELSTTLHPWIPPRILTYKNLMGAYEKRTPTTVTVNGRDMCYALINNIIYICTGAYPERAYRLGLLNNSGYQEIIGTKIDSASVVGRLTAIPLCPFYKQEHFVHLISELEKNYGIKISNSELAQSMNTIVGVHRLEAMEQFLEMNSRAAEDPTDSLNVWEAQFESNFNDFLAAKDSSPEASLECFTQTKILCFFLSDTRFLNESWLQHYMKRKGLPLDYASAARDMVSSWRRGEDETVDLIWNKAIFELNQKKQHNLLQTLIAWRQPGINSRIQGMRDSSVLHAVVKAFISNPKDTVVKLISSLLKAGANPYLGNKDNAFPLMDIAEFGSNELALLFLEAGVNSSFRDSKGGRTAFHYAANRAEFSAISAIHMLQILQQMGCIDTADDDGITPLMLLHQKSNMMPVLYAIEQMGARMDLRDRSGKTLVDRGFDTSFLDVYGPVDFPGFRLDIAKQLAAIRTVLTQQKGKPAPFGTGQVVKKRPVDESTLRRTPYVLDRIDNHFELLELLRELQSPSSYRPRTYSNEASVFPGYDILSNADHQLGWNCFDVAVGFQREDLVKYALDNKNNIEFRNLLAVEIRHALAWTAVHPTAISAEAISERSTPIDLASATSERSTPIGLASATSERSTPVDLASEPCFPLKTETITEADFLLPSSLWTPEIRDVFNHYANVYEKPEVMAALKFCNDEMEQVDGKRLSWEQLGKIFNEEANQRMYPSAFSCYKATVSDYIAPVCMAMDALCCRPDIYETYVLDYYGKKQWFAFNAQFQGEHSTSMMDIVAKMLSTKIVLHSATDGKTYATSAYGSGEIHVGYNGYNHFYRLISKASAEVVRPRLGALSMVSGSSSMFAPLGSKSYSEIKLVSLLIREDSFCTLAIKQNTAEGLKASLFELIISRAETLSQGASANAYVMIPYQTSPNVWALICLKYKQDASDELDELYYFDPLGADIDPSVHAILAGVAMPPTVLRNRKSVAEWDSGLWVVEAAKSIVKSGALPEIEDNLSVRRRHLLAFETTQEKTKTEYQSLMRW